MYFNRESSLNWICFFWGLISLNRLCFWSRLLSSGAVHGEGGGERESAGPQTEDPDVMGGLLLLRGQDSPHHTGGNDQ